MPTTTNIIALSKITQYLWSCAILKENAFNNGSINFGRDIVIYMENAALQYGEEQITFQPPNSIEYLLINSADFLLINSTDNFIL